MAMAVAMARELTASFVKILDSCTLAVLGEMNSFWAISLFDMPAPQAARMSGRHMSGTRSYPLIAPAGAATIRGLCDHAHPHAPSFDDVSTGQQTMRRA